MVVQRLAPGMQHGEESDLRPQMVRIACHGQEGLGHRLKEEVIHHPRVLECEWAEGMREGKHHMDIGHVEQLRFAGREPGGLRAAWTLGAMPITTGVIGNLHVPTLLTLRRVPSQGGGPADRNRPECAVLLRRHGGAIAGQLGGAIPAYHVRYFEGGTGREDYSSGNVSRGLVV